MYAQDVTTTECTELVHVDPVTVTEYLDTVQMDYNFNRGSCNLQLLSQQQQVRLWDLAVQIKCVQILYKILIFTAKYKMFIVTARYQISIFIT